MNIEQLFRDWKAVEEHPAGTVVFTEKDPAEVVYVILQGEVELALQGEPLGTQGPGGVIGEMALIQASMDNATATARTDVRLARLSPEDFRRLLSTSSDFSMHMMCELANRLRAVNRFVAERLGRTE